jgi:hypothetical protein
MRNMLNASRAEERPVQSWSFKDLKINVMLGLTGKRTGKPRYVA